MKWVLFTTWKKKIDFLSISDIGYAYHEFIIIHFSAEEDGDLLRKLLRFSLCIDALPPLGLNPAPVLCFKHAEDALDEDSKRTQPYPTANTCANTLYLPVLKDYRSFVSNMTAALQFEIFTTEWSVGCIFVSLALVILASFVLTTTAMWWARTTFRIIICFSQMNVYTYERLEHMTWIGDIVIWVAVSGWWVYVGFEREWGMAQ